MTTAPPDDPRHGQRVFGGDDYGPSDYREAPQSHERQIVFGGDEGHPAGPPSGWAAAPPQPEVEAAASPSDPHPRRRRRLIGALVASGIVLALAAGGVVWELSARNAAGSLYAQQLESQNIVLNGQDATTSVTGAYAGSGLALVDQFSGSYSAIALDALVSNAEITDLPIHYALFGAPADGSGEIQRVEVSVDIPAAEFLDVEYGTNNPFPNGEVTFENGKVLVTSANPTTGSVTELTMEISADDGWVKREVTAATLDGADLLYQFTDDQRVSHRDWCEDAGLDSYVKEMALSGESAHVVWEIGPLSTADLGLASCLG